MSKNMKIILVVLGGVILWLLFAGKLGGISAAGTRAAPAAGGSFWDRFAAGFAPMLATGAGQVVSAGAKRAGGWIGGNGTMPVVPATGGYDISPQHPAWEQVPESDYGAGD